MLQRYLGLNFCRQNILKLADKPVPLHLLLRKDVPLNLTQQQKD